MHTRWRQGTCPKEGKRQSFLNWHMINMCNSLLQGDVIPLRRGVHLFGQVYGGKFHQRLPITMAVWMVEVACP